MRRLGRFMIKNIKFNKNVFLYLYIVCAVVMIIFRLVMGVIDEDILSEVFLLNFKAYLFASFEYVESYLMAPFDGIGFFIIPLVLFLGLSIRELLIKMFMKDGLKFNISHVIIPIVGIASYFVFRILLKTTMPFSLLEAMLFASITYPTALFLGER